MKPIDQAISELRADLRLALFCKYAVWGMTAALALWGVAVLALRVALGLDMQPLAWGAAGLVVAIIAALVLALRKTPGPDILRAIIDRHSLAGGLILAGAETSLGGWEERVSNPAALQVRWRGGRAWTMLGLSAAFLLSAMLVPPRVVDAFAAAPLDVSQDTDRISKQIQALIQEKIVNKDQAEKLFEQIKKAQEHAQGRDPVKTWEALDHIEKSLSQAAGEAAQKLMQQNEKLSDAQGFAEALANMAAGADPGMMATAMGELGKMFAQAAKEDQALLKALGSDLAKALDKGQFSKEQLEALGKMALGRKGDMREALNRLQMAKLIDPDMLRQFDEMKGFGGDPRNPFAHPGMGGRPGQGGITRGPGHAPMEFGDASSALGARFKSSILPPAALDALKDSTMNGISPDAPQVEPDAGPSESGALQGAAAGGGSANTQFILPEHRGAVERFFQRQR